MKTVLTIITALCITTASFAQTVVKKEMIIEVSDQEKERMQDVILNLSKKLSASLEERQTLNKKDISTLTELLEAIDETHKGEDRHKEIIVKSSNPSEKTSISYAFKIDSDGEIETLEGTEELDLDGLKEKLTELSISISDSDAIKVLVEKLKEKHTVIVKEIKEKEEKTKH